jgi:hypothetical protein
MKLGAIKILMLFLVDNEVLKARRELEGSLEAIEAPWTRWRIKEEDAESDVTDGKYFPLQSINWRPMHIPGAAYSSSKLITPSSSMHSPQNVLVLKPFPIRVLDSS